MKCADSELRRRQAASQRAWYRAVAGGSPGASLLELEGVQATLAPVREWYSIFNGVFYDDPGPLDRSHDDLSRAYETAGIGAWAVWVPPDEPLAAPLLQRRGHALEPWTMGAVFSTMHDPASHLHVARSDGEPIAALVAREHDHDCYFWFVARVPEAQRSGAASELMRHALREARGRGCMTSTLESTAVAETMYERLGYRPLGRYEMWETRAQ